MSQPTICWDCKYHHNDEPTGPRSEIWYNQKCLHPSKETPAYLDVVTGLTVPVAHAYCRDVNDGNCPLFEACGRMRKAWRRIRGAETKR